MNIITVKRKAFAPLVLLSLGGYCLSGAYAAAAAQASSENRPHPLAELREVVVTAQYRRQNVQNVPIAITTFTPETLRNQNITSLAQLSNLTPGVTLTAGAPFSGDSSVLSASIRGIGQSDFAFNINPAVGVYVDGVYYARSIGANVNLLDVQNISILKGPQGTLFGANTIGGAISITTREPGERPYFVAQATGGSFNRRDIGFSADIPIIKHELLSSITFSSQNQEGYQRVIPYPANSPYGETPFVVTPATAWPSPGYQTSNRLGGTGVVAMRGKLLWLASSRLKMTLEGDWTHESQTALPLVDLATYSGNLSASTFSTLYNLCIGNNASTLPAAIAAAGGPPVGNIVNTLFAGTCAQPRGHVPGISIGGAPLLGAGYVGGPPGPFNINDHPGTTYLGTNQPRLYYDYAAANTGNYDTTYGQGPDFARSNIFGFSLTGDYRLTHDVHLKSITAYRQTRWNVGTDVGGTPETISYVIDLQHQYQVSQEFRLLGDALDRRLHYVGGLFYFKESGYVHDFVPFAGLLDIYDGAGNDIENTDYAAYFHLDYQLNRHWEFIAGGRYTDAQAYFIGGQGDLNSFPFGSVLGPQLTGQPYTLYFPPDTPDSQAWHVFDPTGSIQYHFTPNTMAYVTWSKGFLAGGWTTRVTAVTASPTDARYGPETSKAWDAGVKTTLFRHHLIVDADAFYTNFDGIQLDVQRGTSPVLTNAGNAKIQGTELSFESLVGHTGLRLNGSASYIDAYYTSLSPNANFPQYALPDGSTVCPAGPPICAVKSPGSALDAQLPQTPKWKFTLDPEYTLGLPSGATISLIPVYTYTSSMFNDSLNTPQIRRPVTHMIDLSLHYVSPSGRYQLAVGGTNLANDRYITSGVVNYGAGFINGYVNPPREWYATVRVQMH